MNNKIKLTEFFSYEVPAANKAEFITYVRDTHSSDMDKYYDKEMLIRILNTIQLNSQHRGAF